MKVKTTLILFLCICFTALQAQDHDHHDHDHDRGHEHHRHEIGIANSPVYFVKEKEWSYGMHIHYIYNIPSTKFGVGLGYERIFDEHKHNTFGVVGSYRPFPRWTVNAAPGFTFEEDSELNFALHIETTYEVEIQNFHIGPVLEFAYDPEDYHISLGLHVGYGF